MTDYDAVYWKRRYEKLRTHHETAQAAWTRKRNNLVDTIRDLEQTAGQQTRYRVENEALKAELEHAHWSNGEARALVLFETTMLLRANGHDEAAALLEAHTAETT